MSGNHNNTMEVDDLDIEEGLESQEAEESSTCVEGGAFMCHCLKAVCLFFSRSDCHLTIFILIYWIKMGHVPL